MSGTHNTTSSDWDGIGGMFSGKCPVNLFWPFLGKPEVVTQRVLDLCLWHKSGLNIGRKRGKGSGTLNHKPSPGGHQTSLGRSATHIGADSQAAELTLDLIRYLHFCCASPVQLALPENSSLEARI